MRTYIFQRGGSGGPFFLGGGLFFIFMSLVIFVMPEILAYMLATVLMFAGISAILMWWTLK